MIKDLFSFFTILPVGGGDVKKAARVFFLSPLVVGGSLGFISGVLGLVVEQLASGWIGGVTAYLSSLLLTGFHHVDGLADFSDMSMIRGDRDAKIRVLRDGRVGSAAVASVTICLFLGLYSASTLRGVDILSVILLSDVMSRLSGVFVLYASPPIPESQLAKEFSPYIRGNHLRFLLSIFSTLPLTSLGLFNYLISLIAAILVSSLITGSAIKQLGGSSGDVVGCVIEMSRAIILVIGSVDLS